MIRALLVDDEPLALEKLAALLNATERVEVVGTFVHPSDAVAALPSTFADVFFLDIEMPDIDGLALADRILDLVPQAQIVFVTAYDEYAIEAFELNAVDYLLKPVRRERLLKTLDRISETTVEGHQEQRLGLRCFGGFKLHQDGLDGNFKWRTSKAQELFAFLVQRRGEAVSRQTLLDALWDDLDGDRAVTHFHTTLYYLRRNLADAGYADLIRHENGLYWVDTSHINCDYYEFERLSADERGDVPLKEWLSKLVHMYEGGYLAGHSWPWAEPTRQDLEDRYISLVVRLHDVYMQERDSSSAIQLLRSALVYVPVQEAIHERLIHAYILTNDQFAARQQYNLFKRKLQTEYGVNPPLHISKLFHDR